VADGRKNMLDVIQVSTGNFLPHGFENFKLLLPPKIIYKFRQPQQFYWSNDKLHFSVLLQVPIRLYGDSRTPNSFIASVHLQQDFVTRMSVTIDGVSNGNRRY
jgi:hypothetical protein